MQELWTKVKTSFSNQINKYQKEVYYDIREKLWLFTKNISTCQSLKEMNLIWVSR